MNKLIGLLLGLLCLPLQAQAASRIRVVAADEAPYQYQSPTGPAGVSYDILQDIYLALGQKIKVEFMPWARAYHFALTQKNTLLMSVHRMPERETLFEWSPALFSVVIYLYKARSRQDVHLSNLSQLNQYRLGVIKNDSRSLYLESLGFTHGRYLPNNQVIYQMALKGRIDIFPEVPAVMAFTTRQHNMQAQDFVPVMELTGMRGQLHFVFSKGSDHKQMNAINQAILQLQLNPGYVKRLHAYSLHAPQSSH